MASGDGGSPAWLRLRDGPPRALFLQTRLVSIIGGSRSHRHFLRCEGSGPRPPSGMPGPLLSGTSTPDRCPQATATSADLERGSRRRACRALPVTSVMSRPRIHGTHRDVDAGERARITIPTIGDSLLERHLRARDESPGSPVHAPPMRTPGGHPDHAQVSTGLGKSTRGPHRQSSVCMTGGVSADATLVRVRCAGTPPLARRCAPRIGLAVPPGARDTCPSRRLPSAVPGPEDVADCRLAAFVEGDGASCQTGRASPTPSSGRDRCARPLRGIVDTTRGTGAQSTHRDRQPRPTPCLSRVRDIARTTRRCARWRLRIGARRWARSR